MADDPREDRASPGDGRPPEDEPSNRRQLDRLIFEQNLDEVHLLIDFVSGRADRSLSHLAIPRADDPGRSMTPREIIEAIAEMRFPPDGSDAANAKNAAILLLAKDQLSAMAQPTRGLSVAYTAMFIDAEVKTWVTRLYDGVFRRPRRARRRVTAGGGYARDRNDDQDTRVDLAARAFPVLQPHARRFRRWRDTLATFSIFWLLITSIAYWDAGLGRSALERLDQNWKIITDEIKENPALLHCPGRSLGGPGTASEARPAAGDARAAEAALRMEFACQRHSYNLSKGQSGGEAVADIFHCKGLSPAIRTVHVWCWTWLLSGSNPESDNAEEPDAGQSDKIQRQLRLNATYWQMATAILAVFTTYVLPMMFALLGTLIGAFRAILNKIRDAELGPRDFVRMMLGIPTGLVAGVAVGLFLSPSSVPMQGAGQVAGDLTLTASGLGFLAGYASHSFFTYLDTIVATVFPASVQQPATAPTPAPRRA